MSQSCPSCASPVDPLRAGHVAIFGDRFFYFCDVSCRERLAPLRVSTPEREEISIHAPSAAPAFGPTSDAMADPRLAPDLATEPRINGAGAPLLFPPDNLARVASPPPSLLRGRGAQKDEAPRDFGAILLGAGVASGVLAISLFLLGSSSAVVSLRLGLSVLGLACTVVCTLRGPREPTDLHPIVLLAPGFAASALAMWAFIVRDPAAEESATFAGIVVTGIALATWLIDRSRRAIASERSHILSVLCPGTRRDPLAPEESRLLGRVAPSGRTLQDVKPGEEMSVEAGEVLPVDGIVTAGQGTLVPWIGATESLRRREGDAILAGARVVSGRLRIRTTYIGFDRAWVRLTLDPRRRADVHARIARGARAIADRGGLLGLVLAGLAAFANRESPAQVALACIAAYASITTAAVGSMAAVHVARGVLEGLRRGITYRSALDWDRAGDVSVAAFCARGTLLLGEPELADLEPLGKWSEEQVLELAAGAESTSAHPIAMAVQRAAVVRRIRADAVRSPIAQPGLGVTAVASTGEALTVGSRALMLKEKISIAIAEKKIAEIEARGREVLLVALGGRLVGVLGMQDGLRPGARAAVQHLLDAQVEPVLVSGDSRETSEAIGRALDIEHVRPEILPADRALEIERLAQGGLTVAVLGHPRTDEAALSAADVAVAMPSSGAAPGEWAIMLASDDVRDGALAISLARQTKNEARTGLILALAPGIGFALTVAFGLLPAACAPLAALAGAVASAFHARATDLTRTVAPEPGIKGADDFGTADFDIHGRLH